MALTGGCLCGAVRYRLASEPFDAGWCHCRTCQLNSGSPAMAFASIPAADYVVETGAGVIASVASSQTGRRYFCRDCGTPLYMQDGAEPGVLDFSAATLDTPGEIEPRFHIFYESRIRWAEPADLLPRYPRSRAEAGD